MTKRKKRLVTILILIGLIFVFLAYLRIKDSLSESSKRPAIIPNVVISNPQRSEMVRSLNLTGDILPIQQAGIFSKVSGNIEKIYVDIGEFVPQRKLLAIIDTTIYAQNLRQSLGSNMQAEANLQNTKVNYERNKNLFEQRLISQQDVDNSKTAYDIALAQREAANATYKNSLTQLSYCKILAPFSGVITKRYLDAGAYTTASTAAPSSTLFTIMDIDKLKVIANIPEKDVPSLSEVKEANVITDAYPDKIFQAVIRRISESVDLSTRTMQVEIDIDNKDHQLKPGMFANINLILERKQNVLNIPINVVQDDDNGHFVYLVSADSMTQKKYIKTGIQHESKYEVLSGILDQDQVVYVGQSLIKDKMKVRISKQK